MSVARVSFPTVAVEVSASFECHPVCGSEHVLAAGVQRGLIEITLKVIESGGLLHDAVRDLLGQARPEFRQLPP